MSKYLSIIVSVFALVPASAQCDLSFVSVNPMCYGICDGQITIFPTGSSPFNISWSTGENTETIDSLCAGTYTVSMIDDLGCTASLSVTIIEPSEPFIVNTYLVSNSSVSGPCEGQIGWSTTGGQPDYTVNWYDCTTNNLYINSPYFCAGEYYAVFTDDFGCIDTSNCVTVSNNVIGITEMNLSDDFSVYPNPFSDHIQLNGIDVSATFVLTNIYGQVVRCGTIENQRINDLNSLPSGTYLLRITNENGMIFKTVVK